MSSGSKRPFLPGNYLKEQSRFQSIEVLKKLEGDNNQNFVFRADGEKYVLRKSRKISEKETLENERNILEFLGEKDINTLPRSILFDSE